MKEWINGDEERKQIFADIAICEKCSKIVANSEILTSFPILAKYDENVSVFEQLETVTICPDCLMFITRVYESLFDFEG
ncbi:hypothetical protein C4238_03720 [Clostridioides difficile]|nr:hypothetical protein [Clostridioides difficile]